MNHATRFPRAAALAALALAASGLSLAPCAARAASGNSKFGHPYLFVVNGKIPPPFQFRFDFGISPSQWPALLDANFKDASSITPNGTIDVFDNYLGTVNNVDLASAHAEENGVYYTETQMMDQAPADPSNPQWVGTFAYAQWSQTFRKDSVGAYCRFTISAMNVRARSVAIDTARAEMTVYGTLVSGADLIDKFHQVAGVVAWTPAGHPPTLFGTWVIGPMPAPTQSDPSFSGHALMLEFSPYTYYFNVDDSRLAVGDTFTVTLEEMTQTAVGWGEFPGATATFRDPPAGGGIQIEVAGLTPIDGFPPSTAGVQPPPAHGVSALSPAWPNPSRGSVFLTLELARAGELNADVYDLTGRNVASLAHGHYEAGRHLLQWSPRATRADVPAGVYFVRVHGPGLDTTRRVVQIASP